MFQFDATTDGRPVTIMVDRSITGDTLIDELDRLAATSTSSGHSPTPES
jgi:hypothetical protein